MTRGRKKFAGPKPLQPELMERLNNTHELANDMGDGAWWQMLEDTVTEYNREFGQGYEPNDAVHKWVRTSGHFTEQEPSA